MPSNLVPSLGRLHAAQVIRHLENHEPIANSPQSAAFRTFGIHSARPISCFPMMLARGIPTDVAMSAHRSPDRFGLLRVRSVRKTLHTYTVQDAAIAHAATKRYRIRDALTVASRHTTARIRNVIGALARETLLGQESELKHLTARLHAHPRLRKQSLAAIRTTLKLMWESGDLVIINQPMRWNQERRLVRDAVHSGEAELFNRLCETEAERMLIERYLMAYGPASLRDATWWSGLSNGRVLRAIDQLPNIVRYRDSESGIQVFAISSELDALIHLSHLNRSRPDRLHFLGHEDSLLKAYFETRFRYVGTRDYSATFNSIGEVRPTVVRGGLVVGVWKWCSATNEVKVDVLPSTRTSEKAYQLQKSAVRLAADLAGFVDATD